MSFFALKTGRYIRRPPPPLPLYYACNQAQSARVAIIKRWPDAARATCSRNACSDDDYCTTTATAANTQRPPPCLIRRTATRPVSLSRPSRIHYYSCWIQSYHCNRGTHFGRCTNQPQYRTGAILRRRDHANSSAPGPVVRRGQRQTGKLYKLHRYIYIYV